MEENEKLPPKVRSRFICEYYHLTGRSNGILWKVCENGHWFMAARLKVLPFEHDFCYDSLIKKMF